MSTSRAIYYVYMKIFGHTSQFRSIAMFAISIVKTALRKRVAKYILSVHIHVKFLINKKYAITYCQQITPRSRLLIEKLVKKFLAFYGTLRFITVFVRVNYWSLF